MKRILTTTISLLLIVVLSTNIYAVSDHRSNDNYRLDGASNIDVYSTTFEASSSTFASVNVYWIYLHSWVYVNGIVLHEEEKEATDYNFVNWASQTWTRADWFDSFETLSYHSSVDADLGDLSFATSETY